MYRTIDCGVWQDAWVSELPPAAKLLFLYLWTNQRVTACGAYEITLRQMAFETGLEPETITGALCQLAPKIQYWPELHAVAVRNFYRLQAGPNASPTFVKAAQKAVLLVPLVVQQWIGAIYPELLPPGCPSPPPDDGMPTVSIPPAYPIATPAGAEIRDQDQGSGTEQRESGAPAPAPARGSPISARRDRPKRVPESPLPADYPLTEEMRVWCAQEVPELRAVDTEHAQFCRYWAARQNETRTNWRPMWEKWMTDAVTRFAATAAKGTNGHESATDRNARNLRETIADTARLAAGDLAGGIDPESLALPGSAPRLALVEGHGRRVG